MADANLLVSLSLPRLKFPTNSKWNDYIESNAGFTAISFFQSLRDYSSKQDVLLFLSLPFVRTLGIGATLILVLFYI